MYNPASSCCASDGVYPIGTCWNIFQKIFRQFLLIKFFLEHRIFKVFSLEKLSVNLKEEEFITTHVLNSCQGVPLRNSDINPTFFGLHFKIDEIVENVKQYLIIKFDWNYLHSNNLFRRQPRASSPSCWCRNGFSATKI